MTREIYFAGGCFWGTEHFFKQLHGVVSTEVGYANGHTKNPTYQDVCKDNTGFAETVHVVYNSELVTLGFLVEMYFKIIDPLSVNQQGHDTGAQYRTGIFYTNEADLDEIASVYNNVEQSVGCPLAVELKPLSNFYTAEEYHQDYLDKNPEGYCHLPVSVFAMARQARCTTAGSNHTWQSND